MNNASAEFYKRSRAFLLANPGMAVVIHATPAPDNAAFERHSKQAWFTYLRDKGLHSTLDTWRFILSGGGKAITVPCENPELFDPSYVLPALDKRWREPQPSDHPRTRDIRGVLDRTKESLRTAKPRGSKELPEAERKPEKSPQEWLNDYVANPPPIPVLSDAFRKAMNLPPSRPSPDYREAAE